MLCSRGARRRNPFGLPSHSPRVFGYATIPAPRLIPPDFSALPGRSGCPPSHDFNRSFHSSRIGYPSHV